MLLSCFSSDERRGPATRQEGVLACLYRVGDICVAYPNCSYKEKKKEGSEWYHLHWLLTTVWSIRLQASLLRVWSSHGLWFALFQSAGWTSPFNSVDWPGWPRRDRPGLSHRAKLKLNRCISIYRTFQYDTKSMLAGDNAAIAYVHLYNLSSTRHEELSSWGVIFSRFLRGVLKMTSLIKFFVKMNIILKKINK